MALQFGEYPLHLSLDEGGVYTVADADLDAAEPVGIPATFEAERLEIMEARAYAHGYMFVIDNPAVEEAPPASAPPAPVEIATPASAG